MDAPEKLKAYVNLKGFNYAELAGILSVSPVAVGLWMCSLSRPKLITQHHIHYLTQKDMEFPCKVIDWLTDGEKKDIEAGKRAIQRLRRQHEMPEVTIKDRVKGRL